MFSFLLKHFILSPGIEQFLDEKKVRIDVQEDMNPNELVEYKANRKQWIKTAIEELKLFFDWSV